MVRCMVPLILILCAFTLHAESTRFGALGRNDTVVTKESDPIASAAIASEASARQSAVTDLTNKINAESAARTQAFSSVEAQLEALNVKKQDAVVSFSSVDNTGVNVGDSNATGALDHMSGISWIKGSLSAFGLGDRAVEPSAITLFRRSGTTTNQNASRILRLLRWNGSAWYVAYQAVSPVVHNDVTINGGRIEHRMEYIAGSARIPADETIVLCYAPAKSSPVTAVLDFGAKVMAATGTRYLATGQSSTPASPSTAAGWAQILAMELTVTEYKDAIAVLASRVEAIAASAESAQSVAESASVSASDAVATADSAKASASTASLAADGARVIAQSAVSTAQSARATAESALAKASSVEKTANAAATASDVAVLSERVTALEGRPSGDSGLSERIAKVEASISTVSETATAASAAAASASTVAESAKTTATAASATAESAKTSASTAQALAESAASAAEKAQSAASEASTTASAALSKVSTVEKTANAAATAAAVATLSDRVTSLENRPSGGVSDADLAAETSARKAADADLSARIESVANNAAGKATVATLQAQLSSLQWDVSDNTTAISAAQKTASDAAAGVATAQSKANTAASDAATALTRANAADATASTIGAQVAEIHAIAAEAETAVNSVTALAQQAATDAEAAYRATNWVTNDVATIKADYKELRSGVIARARTEWFSFTNQNSHLGWPGTTNRKSEIFINNYTYDGAYMTVQTGDGLKHSSEPWGEGYRRYIEVDWSYVDDTSWIYRNAWTLQASPAGVTQSVSNATVSTTDEFGRVMSTATVTTTTTQDAAVEVVIVDPLGDPPIITSWSGSEGATISQLDGAMGASVSASEMSLVEVSAYDYRSKSTQSVFVPIRQSSSTSVEQTVYAADVPGTARATANDAILTALAQRDASSTVASGVTPAVASSDFIFAQPGIRPTFAAQSPLATSFVNFSQTDIIWRVSCVPVSPHYAVTASHWFDRKDWSSVGPMYAPSTGNGEYFSIAEGVDLSAWARANGYSESEINEARIADLYVYRVTSSYAAGPEAFEDGIIPYVMDRSALDYYYGGSLEGVACYALTQNLCLSYSAFSSPYGDRWSPFGREYDPKVVRADILGGLANCARIYGGDSGRPICMVHDNKPVVVSVFSTREKGPSLTCGAQILDAFIQQHSGGTESLKRISAPTE